MKNMKLKSILLVCVLVTFTCFAFTGCRNRTKQSSNNNEKQAVCYAIAPTANSEGLNLDSPLVKDLAYNTIFNYGYISVVTIDGRPKVNTAQSFDIDDQYKSASTTILKEDAQKNTTSVITYMKQQSANDPQVDYLEGIRLAARSLNSLDGYNKKTIVVVGTGLSTKGDINFRNNLLSVEPNDVLNALEKRNEIPNLKGITVIWQQMGDTAAPQTSLTQTQKERLTSIWKGVIERGGGKFKLNTIVASSIDKSKTYPTVDVIELPKESPINFTKNSVDNLSEDIPIAITEKQVSFIADQTSYLNVEKAKKTIHPIAEYLNRKENNKINILLIGTTAGDKNTKFGFNLSKQRAETVKNTLISFGVNGSRIRTIGLGSNDPWHVSGISTDSGDASINRKVVIINDSSDIAKQLIRKI